MAFLGVLPGQDKTCLLWRYSSVLLVQKLLLEEAGLDMAALRRLSRWGALAPQIGAKINETLRRRTTGSLAMPASLPGRRSLAPSISTSVSNLSSAANEGMTESINGADAPTKSRRHVQSDFL